MEEMVCRQAFLVFLLPMLVAGVVRLEILELPGREEQVAVVMAVEVRL